jgi:hypothetical protein
VGFVRKVVAVILVAIWPAVTSHSLLSHGGLIHVVHTDHHSQGDGVAVHQHLYHEQHGAHEHDEGSHEHNADHHEFAEGDYRSASAKELISKPSLRVLFSAACTLTPLVARCEVSLESPGPAPPGSRVQILQQTWQFSNRAAVPVRAPSFSS